MMNRYLTYGYAVRIFAVGFCVMLVGIALNKGLGLVQTGIIVSFGGFGICCVGLLVGVLAMCRSVVARWQ